MQVKVKVYIAGSQTGPGDVGHYGNEPCDEQHMHYTLESATINLMHLNRILRRGPPKQAPMAMRGKPCLAIVTFETASAEKTRKGLHSNRVIDVSHADRLTSNTVSPRKQCKSQNSI